MSPLGGPPLGGPPLGPDGVSVRPVRLSGPAVCPRRYLITALATMMASPIVASATPMSSAEPSL